MKVVDLVTRNSDQLSLHFSDFSNNLYRFYNFTALEKPKRKKEFFAQRPLEEVISSQICPWPDFGAGEAAGGRNSAPVVAGDEGPVGERQEEGELYPWVARVVLGVAGGGSPAWSRAGGWWRTVVAQLWRPWAVVAGPGRTSEPKGTRSRGRLGSREGGGWGSPVS